MNEEGRSTIALADSYKKSKQENKNSIPDISQKWLLEFDSKSTNALIWDKRFTEVKEMIIPDRNVHLLGFERTLKESLSMVMGGAPNPIKIDTTQNYMVASACRQNSCDEKGFIWYDLIANKGIIAIVNHFPLKKYTNTPHLYITSKNYKNLQEIKQSAIKEIKEWLKNENLEISQNNWTYEF
ncbi:MAG: hypothetical protein ACEPOZ_20505 [Marinifilaceae bacterium]